MSLSKFQALTKVKADKLYWVYTTTSDPAIRASFDTVLELVGKFEAASADNNECQKKSKKRTLFEMKQTDVNKVIEESIIKFCDDPESGMPFFFVFFRRSRIRASSTPAFSLTCDFRF